MTKQEALNIVRNYQYGSNEVLDAFELLKKYAIEDMKMFGEIPNQDRIPAKELEIFEKHWTKSTGKPLDEMTINHMQYAINAVKEALELRKKSLNRDEVIDIADKYIGMKPQDFGVNSYAGLSELFTLEILELQKPNQVNYSHIEEEKPYTTSNILEGITKKGYILKMDEYEGNKIYKFKLGNDTFQIKKINGKYSYKGMQLTETQSNKIDKVVKAYEAGLAKEEEKKDEDNLGQFVSNLEQMSRCELTIFNKLKRNEAKTLIFELIEKLKDINNK